VAGDETPPQDEQAPAAADDAVEVTADPTDEDPAVAAGAAPEVAPAPAGPTAGAPGAGADADEAGDDVPPAARPRPEIPGADLEVDIVTEGQDPLTVPPYGEGEDATQDGAVDGADDAEDTAQPIAAATIDLGASARYRATGKRKTAIARVILRPGTGAYTINGKTLNDYFPRPTLQRNIRQPLEAVGYEERMDVVARMEGGGVSSQAGALRHGISRALLEADPNLRGALKSRGFLTRDARAKERKKAGLKKARKRPQFSKR
jgi:small subunit ribosomal protein S9